jgi:hypothetical protein
MRAITPIRRVAEVVVLAIITLPARIPVPLVVMTEPAGTTMPLEMTTPPAGTTVPPAVAPPATTMGLSVLLEVSPPGRGLEIGGIGCGTVVFPLVLGMVMTVPPLAGVKTVELDRIGLPPRSRSRPNSPRRVTVGVAYVTVVGEAVPTTVVVPDVGMLAAGWLVAGVVVAGCWAAASAATKQPAATANNNFFTMLPPETIH